MIWLLQIDIIIHSIYFKCPGKYIIHKLFLNRPQLVLERESFFLHETLKKEAQKLKDIVLQIKRQDKDNPLIEGLVTLIETTSLLIEGKYINPYKQEQTKR